MANIEIIDDMIINKYGNDIIARIDFYNQIYHHNIWEAIIKEIEFNDNKNYYLWAIIIIELHKCNLTNQVIEHFPTKCEDNLDTVIKKVFHKAIIEEKNKYSTMIGKLVELAIKEKEMYYEIINLKNLI